MLTPSELEDYVRRANAGEHIELYYVRENNERNPKLIPLILKRDCYCNLNRSGSFTLVGYHKHPRPDIYLEGLLEYGEYKRLFSNYWLAHALVIRDEAKEK